ncbi:vitamin B12 ABC transporter permease BtuC [Aeromonas jandaei]|uniref:vitamin B12 ABC transporter permease BtuC n=1 Tax=Aeromonas jandaei TaxID=650 RepID=UPI001ABF5234|nr:vitamin B12 ABC transporter permease BtuC [Aeromonas jandaei]QSR72998.1 vitamin B12 ABC transporter permease BtuC [Aeromonas jandaei]
MYLSLVARQQRWQRRWLLGLLLLTLLLFLFSLAWGEFVLLPWQPLGELEQRILLELRLPRALLALLAGAALACGGAVLQVMLHNPVAEPGLLGVSSGAGLAAMVAMAVARALGVYLPGWGLSLAAFGGALLVTMLLIRLARRARLGHARLLLFGVAIGILTNAAMTWLLYFADDSSLREFMFWMMGSLSYGSQQLGWWWLLLPLTLLWLCRQGKVLQQLLLGETQARLMGLDVDKMRVRLVLAVCLLTGLAVSLCGVIGFVGLVVPHQLRLCGGSDQRFLLPASALGGGALLLAADLVARSALNAGELPIGVITASVGAPLFIYLLLRQDAHAAS